MPSFLPGLLGSRPLRGDVSAKQLKPPSPLQAVGSIMYRLHTLKPLGVEHELPQTLLDALTARLKFGLHVTQRTARVLLTLLLRTCVRHPLGECAGVATTLAARQLLPTLRACCLHALPLHVAGAGMAAGWTIPQVS